MNTNNEVIIIGAGIAGLSAGSYLQMQGYTTRILEMGDCCGGVCVSWTRKGYTFDGATNWVPGLLPGCDLHGMLNELIDFGELPTYYGDVFMEIRKNGQTLVVYKNADRLKREMLRIAPEDNTTITEFTDLIKSASSMVIPWRKAIEVSGIGEKLLFPFQNRAILLYLLKWRRVTIAQFADRFHNPVLRDLFLHIFPGHEFFSIFGLLMALGWMHGKGEAYPLGGSATFTQCLEQRYRSLGGTVDFRKGVDTIDIRNGKVRGVSCNDNSRYSASTVIAACDFHDLFTRMISPELMPGFVRKAFTRWRVFPSLVTVGIGVARSFDPHQNKIYCDFPQPLSMGTFSPTGLMARICSFDPGFAPPGKTSICVHVRTHDYHYWVDMRNNDQEKYRAEKKRVADAVLDTLDSRFSALKADVEVVDVSTPASYIRYTNNWKGSYQSWAPTPESVGALMKKTVPGIKGLYLTGHWLWPGGGLPAVIRLSRDVAQIICARDGKKFEIVA